MSTTKSPPSWQNEVRDLLGLDRADNVCRMVATAAADELESSSEDPCGDVARLARLFGPAWATGPSSPLMGACLRKAAFDKNVDVVKQMLAAGVRWDAASEQTGLTPVHFAAAANDPPSLLQLLAKARAEGAGDPTLSAAREGDTVTPLHLAAAHGSADCVRMLLSQGADANAGGQQQTPLQLAAAGGHLACVRKLLAAGARADALPGAPGGPCGVSALFLAACNGHLACVDALLEAGAGGSAMLAGDDVWDSPAGLGRVPFKPIDSAGRPHRPSPLDLMAYYGLADGVKAVLTRMGGDARGACRSSCRSLTRALHYAVLSPAAPPVVQQLLQAGARPDGMIKGAPLLARKSGQGEPASPPLATAVFKRDRPTVQLLLNAGAVPTRDTLVDCAVFRCLEVNNLVVQLITPEQRAALYLQLAKACRAGDSRKAVSLLEQGAPAGGWALDSRGGAVVRGDPAVDETWRPWDLLGPLEEAIRAGHGGLVQILLDRGAPLHFLGSRAHCLFGAVEAERPRILEMLLKHGGRLFGRADLTFALDRARQRLEAATAAKCVNSDAGKAERLVKLLGEAVAA